MFQGFFLVCVRGSFAVEEDQCFVQRWRHVNNTFLRVVNRSPTVLGARGQNFIRRQLQVQVLLPQQLQGPTKTHTHAFKTSNP